MALDPRAFGLTAGSEVDALGMQTSRFDQPAAFEIPYGAGTPEQAPYRVLSADDVMGQAPDLDERLRQIRSGGRQLRPKQQRAFESIPEGTDLEGDLSGLERKQRLAVMDQRAIDAGDPTRRERWGTAIQEGLRGMAKGGAVGGQPHWVRAAASVRANEAMDAGMAQAESKGRMAELSEAYEEQAADDKRRAELIEDPMVEMDGLQLKMSDAEKRLTAAGTAERADSREARLAAAEERRVEDADRKHEFGVTREDQRKREAAAKAETDATENASSLGARADSLAERKASRLQRDKNRGLDRAARGGGGGPTLSNAAGFLKQARESFQDRYGRMSGDVTEEMIETRARELMARAQGMVGPVAEAPVVDPVTDPYDLDALVEGEFADFEEP